MRSDALAATRRDFLEASLAGGAIAIAGGSLPASAAERDDKSPKPTIAAYTGAMSVVQGQSLPFHVSTSVSRYKATITRVGLEPTVAWKSDAIAGAKHPVPKDASTRGCQWPVAFQVPIGSDWRSGVYLATLAGDGATTQTFFIVRSATPGTRARILFQLATNTYQAYNNWGGSCLYSGPGFPTVSFDRPFNLEEPVLKARPGFYNPNLACYRTWDEPFIRWAERAGYELDYCANLDIEFDPDALARYRLVVAVGHDEYWSAGMRDNVEAFIGNGGNVAFLSGNTICWQVRVEDGGRRLTCYKQAHDKDPVFGTKDSRSLTTLWSDPAVARPENSLSGVGFPYGGYNGFFGEYETGPGAGEYTVYRPDHWLFAGTGLSRNETFGRIDEPWCPQPGIAGYECDGCEMIWENGLPVPTGRDGTPKTMQILAAAPARMSKADDTIKWAKALRGALPGAAVPTEVVDGPGSAVFGIYERGGTVVATGSCGWSYGLAAGNHVVDRIIRNMFDRLSA
jgi:hypothetical protein